MKVKKLTIESHRHIENLELDFTYPNGHKKSGQVLDKVCLIGQSATGKTSILEMLNNSIWENRALSLWTRKLLQKPPVLSFKGALEIQYEGSVIRISGNKLFIDNTNINVGQSPGQPSRLFSKGVNLFYFSSDIISPQTVGVFDKKPQLLLQELANTQNQVHQRTLPQSEPGFNHVEFIHAINQQVWLTLLKKILDFRQSYQAVAQQWITAGLIGDRDRMHEEYLKWAETNKSPLEPFAQAFNPVLKKLNLEIDPINTDYPVPIKLKQKNITIPISALSTGTKGLLLSLFPLYHLNTVDSVVLIDEPERSLFPDMQRDLISHYKRLAPKAQFIVATHSPFIAASFEPEERFILSFDSKDSVQVARGNSPVGDDPNDILNHDFKIDYYNEFGREAYAHYRDLKSQMIAETDSEKKRNIMLELTKLGDKYNF